MWSLLVLLMVLMVLPKLLLSLKKKFCFLFFCFFSEKEKESKSSFKLGFSFSLIWNKTNKTGSLFSLVTFLRTVTAKSHIITPDKADWKRAGLKSRLESSSSDWDQSVSEQRLPDVDKDCDVGKDMEIILEPPNSSGKRCTVRSGGREETKQEMPSLCFNYCWINVELQSNSKQWIQFSEIKN